MPVLHTRRMCAAAAHLVDCVFPEVPVRQWVLSVPFELRLLLARSAALTALDGLFLGAIFGWQRARARELGLAPHAGRGAGITHIQRFGGALNLNVHLHAARHTAHMGARRSARDPDTNFRLVVPAAEREPRSGAYPTQVERRAHRAAE